MSVHMNGPAAKHLMKSDEAFHYARAVVRDDKGVLAERRGVMGAPEWISGGVLYRYDFCHKWTFDMPRRTRGDIFMDIYITPGPGMEEILLSSQLTARYEYRKNEEVTINMQNPTRWSDGTPLASPIANTREDPWYGIKSL